MKALDAQTAALAPSSYHDFSGLSALKGKAQVAGQGEAALRAAAQQFEAMFVQEMMRTMRQAGIKSDLMESHALETFEGMFDKEVSVQMARRGSFGMADMLVQQMKRHLPASETAAAVMGTGAADEDAAQGPASTESVLRSRAAAAGLPLTRPSRPHALQPAHGTHPAAGLHLARPGAFDLPGRSAPPADATAPAPSERD